VLIVHIEVAWDVNSTTATLVMVMVVVILRIERLDTLAVREGLDT